MAVARESIRLAFVAALQHLPARQRAVLILREVLRWQATEVAELLDTTVASVNSALQRARATLAEANLADTDPMAPMDDEQQALLTKYVDAFERYDLDAFVTLLSDDVRQSMPPFPMWLVGGDQIKAWMQGPGVGVRGVACSSRRSPTARPRSGSTGRAAPAAASSRGRSTCSRSTTARSSASTSSSTPTRCSRCSACRRSRPRLVD